MVNSRNKGSTFERDVSKMLFDHTGFTFERDLNQYRQSDLGDLICHDKSWPFVLECKRYANGNHAQAAWIAQATRAAWFAGKYPAVIYKYDRQQIRVSIPFDALAEALGGACSEPENADLTFSGFCYCARELMAVRAHI